MDGHCSVIILYYLYSMIFCQFESCLISLESSENYYPTLFVNFIGVLYQSIRFTPENTEGLGHLTWIGIWNVYAIPQIYAIYFMYVRSKKNQFIQYYKTKRVINSLIIFLAHGKLEDNDEQFIRRNSCFGIE